MIKNAGPVTLAVKDRNRLTKEEGAISRRKLNGRPLSEIYKLIKERRNGK